MAEEYVGSKELTVTVLQEQPLCVTEIKAGQDKGFYNYEAKYEKNGSIHDIPAKISKNTYNQAMSWALRVHQIIVARVFQEVILGTMMKMTNYICWKLIHNLE